MGSYPSVVDWNNDGKHDLLVGDSNGNVQVYLNAGTNTDPRLAEGVFIQANGTNISVGNRAAPVSDDWNGDGNKDLVIGNLEGNIVIYLNKGTDELPVFDASYLLRVNGDIFNAGSRSSPRIIDWNGDGLKDLLVGVAEGYVYYLKNVGTHASPLFDKSEMLFLKNGEALRYPSPVVAPRPRVFISDWNNDGLYDIVLGGIDGKVVLFLADREPSYSPFISARIILRQTTNSLFGLKKKWQGWHPLQRFRLARIIHKLFFRSRHDLKNSSDK